MGRRSILLDFLAPQLVDLGWVWTAIISGSADSRKG